jgi:hypothetical protein
MNWTFIAIITGSLIRLVLLIVSRDNLGYYSGDAIRYLTEAQSLLAGQIPMTGLYPLG